MIETAIGQANKDDADQVTLQGFEAMMHGDGEVIIVSQNKGRLAIARLLPADVAAEMHRKTAEPRTAR
jgi:hypothetical protein